MNVVRLYGYSDAECGYCKGARAELVNKRKDNCSRAYTVVVENLHPGLYEDLLRRGWRRSGVALYKPDNWASCCPAITIRLPVDQFSPTKKQKKIVRQMKSLLEPELDDKDPKLSAKKSKAKGKQADPRLIIIEEYLQRSGTISRLQQIATKALSEILTEQGAPAAVPNFKILSRKGGPRAAKKTDPPTENIQTIFLMSSVCAAISGRSKGIVDRGTLSTQLVDALRPLLPPGSQVRPSPPTKVATDDDGDDDDVMTVDPDAQHKRHRIDDTIEVIVQGVEAHVASGQVFIQLKIQNLPQADIVTPMANDSSKAVADRLANWWNNKSKQPIPLTEKPPYELKVTTIPAHESALDPSVHRLYWKYQTKVHGDPDPFVDEKKDSSCPEEDDFGWASRAPKAWKDKALAMLQSEYGDLPENRQKRLKKGFDSFYDFLVENPFAQTPDKTGQQEGHPLGTYHQQYRLGANGLLIAVGVIDILPQGISSVYLYYDPSFADELLAMGKYSILQEIEWTKGAKLPYYYLGYYIESCPKMRYKADYQPSELLCPTTYNWISAEEAKATIQKESPLKHCCTLSGEPPAVSTLVDDDVDSCVARIPMELGHGTPVTIAMLTPDGQDFVRPLVKAFATEASCRVALQCTIDFR